MKVRLFIGDTLFEDLPEEKQEEAKQKYTDAYANIVLDRVIEMMNQGKSKAEIMSYLGLN
ncbi:small nuclear ribonucleoprotein (snRNP)-like protein [Anaerosolibacter carboniphilus]|uniref:Small nuclear ribonucleoprotein (SnRNP)-like protein n=1 Tax=Anaerosolibacter carboniphilus TaxID=1417629 RepID=A0A841L0S1_9FIRM|nr:hypothetical protein [Anaerosolibacter carboniphilus]MBB6215979.1 small nuclear ribonucleoprotein (snRNP)-like protein [Anaerosolibacter carboniphilus]